MSINSQTSSSSTATATTMNSPLSPIEHHAQKRRVTFSREVMVRPYDASPSNEDRDDLWYTSDEIRQQRMKDMEIVETIRRGAASSFMSVEAMVKVVHLLSEQATWNVRGLEAFLDNGSKKTQNKLKAVLAVLMEQDRQDMEGDSNDKNISRRYKQVSKRCQEEAHKRAVMDQVAATAETFTDGDSSVDCGRLLTRSVQLSKVLKPRAQTMSPCAA